MAASATGTVTESRGFRDAFAAEAPLWIWSGFESLRRGLSSAAAALGGPQDQARAAAVVLVAGLVLAGVGYWLALAVRCGSLRWIVGLSLVFQATLLAMPGLLSTDLLTYATYGRLAGVYGHNPYLAAPSAVAADPLVQWLDTRPEHASPYGPVWTLLSMGMAQLTAGLDPLAQALGYRVLGSLALLSGTWLVWLFTRSPAALLLFAWNPLLLVEGVANAHNDGLMMVIALGGLLLLQPLAAAGLAGTAQAGVPGPSRSAVPGVAGTTLPGAASVVGSAVAQATAVRARRLVAGLLVLGLAALVKYVPGLLLLYAGAALARGRPRVVAASALLLLGVGVGLWLPWLGASGPGVLLASISAGGERYVNALLDLPTGWLATHVVDRSGQDLAAAEAAVRAGPRALVRVLFVVYVTWEGLRVWRRHDLTAAIEAATRGYLVALLLVVTQVLAWYFIWPVAVAGVLGWRSTLARSAVAYSVTYLPVFYVIHTDLVPGGGLSAALLLLVWAILPLGLAWLAPGLGLLATRRPTSPRPA